LRLNLPVDSDIQLVEFSEDMNSVQFNVGSFHKKGGNIKSLRISKNSGLKTAGRVLPDI